MADSVAQPDPDALAKRNVYVLVAAQAVLGAQLPMVFTVAGQAGKMLSPNPCWATLPVTMMVVGSMLTANPLSALMQRFGRRTGFVAGAAGGFIGAGVGAWGLSTGSFALFLLGALLTGIYMSANGFYRFAATDTATVAFRPRAISWVMAGGLLSAIVGPNLVKVTAESMVVPFLGTYLAAMALNAAGVFLFALLRIPKAAARTGGTAPSRSWGTLLRNPRIAVAVICATVCYALMNLVMTSSPLAVIGCGFSQSNVADIMTSHVLAMYVPAFFTGGLIARFGTERIMGLGLFILACAGAVAIAGVALPNFFGTMMLLGLGWNFGFIGATTMLASSYAPEERSRVQGMNDFLVFAGVTLASLSSGGLMNCSGGSPQEGWTMVNLAMLPFLVLAGGALIWLALQPSEMRERPGDRATTPLRQADP